jgi:hypothetical protein
MGCRQFVTRTMQVYTGIIVGGVGVLGGVSVLCVEWADLAGEYSTQERKRGGGGHCMPHFSSCSTDQVWKVIRWRGGEFFSNLKF